MKPNEEQFKELLTQARTGNTKAIYSFIEMNKPVVLYTVNMLHISGKYLNFTKDELMNLGMMAIYKSISSYNEINNYNNHLIYLIRSEIKNFNATYGSVVKQPRKEDKIKFTDEFNNEAYEEDNTYQNEDNSRHIKQVLELNLDKLSSKERSVLKCLYFNELNNRETAKVLNLSEGNVSNLHRVGLNKLRKLMSN